MTKKEIYDEVQILEHKLSKVYYEIMNAENISFFHNYKINKKLLLITENLTELFSEYEFNNKLEKLKLLCLALLSSFNAIISFLFILTQNPCAMATLFFGLYTSFKGMKLCKQDPNIDTELKKTLNDMFIITTNCETFINKKMKNYELRITNELEEKNENIVAFFLANNILQSYLEGEIAEIPNNNKINQIIVRILQEDLNTDINDIEVLMAMAKDKISREKISEELQLARKNPKKGKN